jgi:hypothetical protein
MVQVLVQRSLRTGARAEDERVTSAEVHDLIKRWVLRSHEDSAVAHLAWGLSMLANRLVDKYGEGVIDYEEYRGVNLPIKNRLALWLASDILMVSAVRYASVTRARCGSPSGR